MRQMKGWLPALMLLSACGGATGSTQAQKADTYAAVFKTQFAKVDDAIAPAKTDCLLVDLTACALDGTNMGLAARAALAALPAAPGCLRAADSLARAGFSRVDEGMSATSHDSAAADKGISLLEAAWADIQSAKC